MAPMSEAISVRPAPFDSTLLPPPIDASSDAQLYTGVVDPEWTIGRFVNSLPFITIRRLMNMNQ